MKDKPLLMTLCSECLSIFRDINYVKPLEPHKYVKENCTYCGVRYGYDYLIYPKKERGNNNEHGA